MNELLGSVSVAEANQLIAGLQAIRDRLAQKEAMR